MANREDFYGKSQVQRVNFTPSQLLQKAVFVRIALVHDFLIEMGDREKVLMCLADLFKGADIFTLVYEPEKVDPFFQSKHIVVSALQSIPFGKKKFVNYLPFYWNLIGGLNLTEYDLIISSSVVCAKWVRTSKTAMHVCYCHTPARAIWGLSDNLFDRSWFSPSRWPGKLFSNYLKWCDLSSNHGVTYFMASTTDVQNQIKELYHRESELFFPPVEVERFNHEKEKGEYFILAASHQPSEQAKQLIGLFTGIRKPLRVVVLGQMGKEWNGVENETVQVSAAAEGELPSLFSKSKGLICVDGDVSPVLAAEALAAGCPLLLGSEVYLNDLFIKGETGAELSLDNKESFVKALEAFEKLVFNPENLKQKVSRFSKERFLFKTQVYFRRLYGIETNPENEKL